MNLKMADKCFDNWIENYIHTNYQRKNRLREYFGTSITLYKAIFGGRRWNKTFPRFSFWKFFFLLLFMQATPAHFLPLSYHFLITGIAYMETLKTVLRTWIYCDFDRPGRMGRTVFVWLVLSCSANYQCTKHFVTNYTTLHILNVI